MKRKLMFLALAGLGLASCNGGLKKADGGLLYNIIVDKPGPSLQPGDFLALSYIMKNDADSVMQSSYDLGRPVPQLMQKPQVKGDIFTGLSYLSEGDSAVIKLNIDSLSKGKPRDKSIKGKYVVYVIKINKVIAKGNLSDQVFQGRYMDYMKSLADVAKKAEPVNVKKYIDDNKLNVTKTDSGLYYMVTKQGSGIKPVIGDTVVVNYTGRFLTGKAFETSVKSDAVKYKLPINPMNPYKPIRFAIGAKGMIKGWVQGMQLLNKGSKATLILPSSLAYGEQGNGPIQAFTPLIFDVELVDVIHPNPNAPKPVSMVPAMPAQHAVKK
jgi:FKBP-type peptidyl-prolyl cis-trans isomerase FkpA